MASFHSASYGKHNINLLKVVRLDDGTHIPYSLKVSIQLEGDIAASYTHADNTNIVATDTQKLTTFILARKHSVWPPELFAATLGSHFITEYGQMTVAHVEIEVNELNRAVLSTQNTPHTHTFIGGTREKRVVKADVYGIQKSVSRIEITSGIHDLELLKTTGSAFHSFHRDSYTRLPETDDRVLATKVMAEWQWQSFPSLKSVQDAAGDVERAVTAEEQQVGVFQKAYKRAREITIDTFAKDESPSVQHTMYLMAEKVLDKIPQVTLVAYELPNIHNFDIDLFWFDGLDNTSRENDVQVYAPQADPNGLIKCSVRRERAEM